MMKIYITKIEKPGPEDGQELPVVHYKGTSRSLDNSMDGDANSGLRGKSEIVLLAERKRPA
jgi:hypothetical protein